MRALLLLALAGLIVALALLLLYGVIGPRPTLPGAAVVLPPAVSRPLQPRAPDGPIYILLAGTSLTSRGDWPEKLERALASCAAQGVTVERLAKAGLGIRWGLPALRTRLADTSLPRPDIIVAEFGGNDASPRQGLPLFLARERTRSLIATIREAGAIPFLSTMSPGWSLDALGRPGQARYHGMYRDIAAETGAGLIDTVPEWLALSPETRHRLVPDNGHPNDEGAERITIPAFLSALMPMVCG